MTGLNRAAAAQKARHEFAGKGKPGALVLGEGHEGAARLMPHDGRIRRRDAFCRKHHGFVKVLLRKIGYAGLAHRDDRGGEVEDEGTVLVGRGHGAAEGVRSEACGRAAVGRNERIVLVDVDKVNAHHAGRGRLFAVGADAAQMAGMLDRVKAHARFLGALDRDLRRLVARALTVAEIAVELQYGAPVLFDRGRGVGFELPLLEVVRVHGGHADAVAVVAAQVRFEHVARDDVCFVFVASRSGEKMSGGVFDLTGCVAHGLLLLSVVRPGRKIPVI